MSPRSFHALLLAAIASGCARRRAVDVGPPGPVVTSDPPGLQIVLDGQPVGRATPARLESWEPLLPHEILLESPGRVPFRREIPAGDPPSQVDAKLPPAAFVDARSEPAGASVLIADAVAAPQTPATVPIPAGQPVQVTLSLSGYISETATVTVAAGETEHLVRQLRRGELVDLQSDPQGASVELDGKPVGEAPTQLSAEVGHAHLARMSLPGLLPCERRFEVKAGEPQTVTCVLDDQRARMLRHKLEGTELSLKVAQRQLDSLDGVHPQELSAAMVTDRRRGRLQDLVDRLTDEEDEEQGDLEAHRTELEERFEAARGGGH